jgi:outer membrane biosynthesis protein TonB
VNSFERIAVCAAISLVAHLGIEQVLELLPPLAGTAAPAVVQVTVVEPPPPVPVVVPEPPPEPPKPEPPPEPPKPTPQPIAKPQPVARPSPTPPKPTTDPEPPALVKHADDDSDEPVFGVDMSSTSSAGGGPGMTVGHGHGGGGGGGPGSAAPIAKPAPVPGTGDAPIGANEATKMPLPQGRCYGKYTPEATAAGTEGTVVLDLTVDEHGHARDIVATEKLPNGLTDSAIAALRACTFTPGEKDGHASAVRIRGFKIRFVLQESAP